LEKTRKWRWGKHRWILLLLIILSVIGVNIIAPVQPHIQVAAETLSAEPLFTLPVLGDFYLTNTILAMLLMDIVIILIALGVRNAAKKNELAPGGIGGAFEMLIEMLYNLTQNTAGKFAPKIFPWFATILIVVLFANLLKLIPGFETVGLLHHAEHGYETQALGGNWYTVLNQEKEGGSMVTPFLRGVSTDLNFTLALALIAVGLSQYFGVKTQKLGYFKKFFDFSGFKQGAMMGVIMLFVGLLELIAEFARIISFSFRLFGNIFAGEVLLLVMAFLIPYIASLPFYGLELFVGFIQALVFMMLALVFFTLSTQGHGGEAHRSEEHH